MQRQARAGELPLEGGGLRGQREPAQSGQGARQEGVVDAGLTKPDFFLGVFAYVKSDKGKAENA